MSTLLKDLYSPAFYERFSEILGNTLSHFEKEKFTKSIFNENFEQYELKERMIHTARVLKDFLPDNFPEAAQSICRTIDELRSAGIKENTLEYMFFPEFISMYGLDDFDNAVPALEFTTQFTSCEFAVRPFILKYEQNMLDQMLVWSEHPSNKVRRLASEGSRPRLPWAMALPFLKKDPVPVLPILENLKQDPCEVVRRSVANNLNDIAKDNPETVIEIAKRWKGISKETDAIIKHACRTLLKNAHPEVMQFYGLDGNGFSVEDLFVDTPIVKIGEDLRFSFSITNEKSVSTLLRLEYGVYFKKNNGKNIRKVFKISEREYKAGERCTIDKKHSFRLITTRKYYEGEHRLSIILNGQEKVFGNFEVVV